MKFSGNCFLRRCLVQIVVWGTLLLVVPVSGQVQNPRSKAANEQSATTVAEQALERVVVTTAARKMGEVQRETEADVIAAVPEFFKGVAENYPGQPVLYGAMNKSGRKLAGMGPPPEIEFPVLHHVTGADGFFKYNVLDTWKQWKASQLNVPPDSPEVFQAWADTVADGHDIPAEMLNTSSTGAMPNAWWSPDARMLLPTCSDREQGNDDFFTLCHVVSLAPEWYPNGLVRINFDPAGQRLIRPVSFDGMTSPLWVQHPPNRPATTGGRALETLNKDQIRLDQLVPCQAYILTAPMTVALQNSPSVNDYATDLRKVNPGNTAESHRVAAEEIAIVQETRLERQAADRAFREYFDKQKLPTPLVQAQAIMDLIVNGKAQPVENTHQQLKAGMEQWARGGHVEHRGQRFSADRYHRESAESADAAQAIGRAATELMAESEDPRVLNMVLHLGGTRDTAFYTALLDRLEGRGPALPEAAGVRYETLREDMLWKLSEPHPATTPELSARTQALLEQEEAHHIHLAHLHHGGSGQEIVDVLEKVSVDKADPWLVALAGAALAKRHPDQVLAAAAHVAKLPPHTRELFFGDVRRAMSDEWLQGNGAELQKVLQLPDR